MSPLALRIRPHVQAELAAARLHESRDDFDAAFRRLERAHVLGQTVTREHVRVHWAMLRWSLRRCLPGEAFGQLWRTAAAALKTVIWVPAGNTGGTNVSGFRSLPIPTDLQRLIDAARD